MGEIIMGSAVSNSRHRRKFNRLADRVAAHQKVVRAKFRDRTKIKFLAAKGELFHKIRAHENCWDTYFANRRKRDYAHLELSVNNIHELRCELYKNHVSCGLRGSKVCSL